jgi:hypothetical protein
LWKLDIFQSLESKEGLWKSFDRWRFNDDEKLHSIYIENRSNTKVLGTTKDDKVILEDKDEGKKEQLWTRGVPDDKGYFTIENEFGKVMTVISNSSLEIKGIITLRWIIS